MPIKIEYKTEQQVKDINMTGLVSYSDVIDETYRLLTEKSLTVTGTIYKPNANGDTVTAIFSLGSQNTVDTDLQMSLTWTHSYHKAIRFQCNVSGIDKDDILVVRDPTDAVKHRRSSDPEKYKTEMFDDLKLEISYIEDSFEKIIKFKNDLVSTKANIGAASVTLGLLYCEEQVLTTSQVAVIKDQILSSEINNGWDMYKCFGEGLKDSHPKQFLQDHIKVHSFFEEVFAETTENTTDSVSLATEVFKPAAKTVNEEIKEQYNFISVMPSVTFL